MILRPVLRSVLCSSICSKIRYILRRLSSFPVVRLCVLRNLAGVLRLSCPSLPSQLPRSSEYRFIESDRIDLVRLWVDPWLFRLIVGRIRVSPEIEFMIEGRRGFVESSSLLDQMVDACSVPAVHEINCVEDIRTLPTVSPHELFPLCAGSEQVSILSTHGYAQAPLLLQVLRSLAVVPCIDKLLLELLHVCLIERRWHVHDWFSASFLFFLPGRARPARKLPVPLSTDCGPGSVTIWL